MAITALNEFQKQFILWGWNKARCVMQASAGSGKSLAAVSFYCALHKKVDNFGKLCIIVKTKSCSVFDSALSAFKLSGVKLIDTSDMGLFSSSYDFPSDVYILSSFLVTKLVFSPSAMHRAGLQRLMSKISLLVLDEHHTYRVYNSKQTQAVKFVCDHYQHYINNDSLHHRLIGVSATQIMKDLTNIYPLFSLLDPPLFGTYKSFMSTYCVTEERMLNGYGKTYSRNGSYGIPKTKSFTQILGFKNTDVLKAKIEPYIFTWHSTSFNFNYKLHYYQLTLEERQQYNTIIEGIGLDKQYAITITNNASSIIIYRDASDIFYQDTACSVSITIKDLYAGASIFYDGALYQVAKIDVNKKSASYSVRCVKALLAEGVVQERLKIIGDLLESYGIDSVLINCAYHNTIDETEFYLHKRFPGRRIVKLTGKTPSFQSVFRSVNWKSDIVILSRAAGESLSMYTKHIILSDIPTNPGAIEQLIGRVTRHDSPHKDFTVDILLNARSSITGYFYERLRFLLCSMNTNTFVTFESLPESVFLEKYKGAYIDLAFLKTHLLWRKVKL
jgi:hypothetical protein